jgi:hypothetical protein
MTADKPPKKPRAGKARGAVVEAVPLADRYAYELKKRSSLPGILQAALDGDREALKDVGALGSAMLARVADGEQPPTTAEWREFAEGLACVLSQIQSGESPNVAFGYEQPGSEGAHERFRTLQRQWVIGRTVAGHVARGTVDVEDCKTLRTAGYLVKPGDKMTLELASELAAKRYGVSRKTAEHNYLECVNRDNSELMGNS